MESVRYVLRGQWERKINNSHEEVDEDERSELFSLMHFLGVIRGCDKLRKKSLSYDNLRVKLRCR